MPISGTTLGISALCKSNRQGASMTGHRALETLPCETRKARDLNLLSLSGLLMDHPLLLEPLRSSTPSNARCLVKAFFELLGPSSRPVTQKNLDITRVPIAFVSLLAVKDVSKSRYVSAKSPVQNPTESCQRLPLSVQPSGGGLPIDRNQDPVPPG